MDAKQITTTLLSRWIGDRAAIPNYKGNGSGGESDLFLVTRSHYCEEVEIKVSIWDFRRDFKKAFKHGCLNNDPQYDFTRTNRLYLFPRRFWFAVPGHLELAVNAELRRPYGLLVVSEGKVREVRKASPIAGARKLTSEELFAIAKCMTFRVARAYKAPDADRGGE